MTAEQRGNAYSLVSSLRRCGWDKDAILVEWMAGEIDRLQAMESLVQSGTDKLSEGLKKVRQARTRGRGGRKERS